jgi:hypothetical protein
VADHRGLGGLLTTQNHARFCAHNFGREVLTRPLDARAIGAEIDRYDAADAADVTKLVRDTASLERQLELLESVLGDAISLFRRSPATSDARQRALSSYLARHLPRHGEPSPRHAPQAGSEADPRVTHLDRQVSILTERLSALELERVLHAASPARAPSTASSNVLERSEALDAVLAASRIVAVERVDPGLEGCSTYLVRACGGDSEHYADHSVAASTGRWTFALDVREVSSPRARIQLLDTRANGVFGDFDFRREEICVVRVGQALRCNGGARAGGDGWYRLWITADLPPGDAEIRVVIQLLDRQERFGFTPSGEAILIRCLQLEPGDRPTPYQPAPERQRAARSRWARLAGKLVARL